MTGSGCVRYGVAGKRREREMTDPKLADDAVCMLLDQAIGAFARRDLAKTERLLLRAMKLSDKHLEPKPSRTEKFMKVFWMLSEIKGIGNDIPMQ